MEPKTVVQSKPLLQQCSRKLSGWRSLLSFSESLHLAAQAMVNLKDSALLGVIPSFLGGPVAFLTLRVNALRTSLTKGWANKRFRTGALIVMLGVPCWFMHRFFSVDTRMDDFYYVNFAFYFNNVKPYLCGFFVSIGFFLALPQKYSFRWWAIAIAFFCITELYDRTFVYNDPMDFQQSMPNWRVYGLFTLSMIAFAFSVDYLVYRYYHLENGTAARIIGIARVKGLPVDQKMDTIEQLAQEAEQFNARI